ncbi:MAG: VOC family protein [Parcubacteria group bacterium]|nr:VOC family protein [Parcubacteria group bacterium]
MKIKELGHIVLYVTDLKRSCEFYRDALGFRQVGEKRGMALFSSGRTHHELLLIEVGGIPETKHYLRPGLYHIGFKIGDRPEDVRRAYRELLRRGVTIVGSGDHTITHSLYVLDPDGNEIELYADVSDRWRKNSKLILTPVRPLDLD